MLLSQPVQAFFEQISSAAMASEIGAVRLGLLREAHDDLDAAIAALMESPHGDDLLVTRLKKRKLQLKDEIAWVLGRMPQSAAS